MFALEALEPRRFLSADGVGQEQIGIPTDAIALRDHGWAEFHPATDTGWFSFEAQAGTVYNIRNLACGRSTNFNLLFITLKWLIKEKHRLPINLQPAD